MNSFKVVKVAYFSGTGGTKKVADCFEKQLVESNLKVDKLHIRKDMSEENKGHDLLILLYSVHAFNAPALVYEWLESIPEVKDISAVVVSVSGGGEVTPNTACRVGAIRRLEKKGYKVIYESMIVMPSNWITPTKKGLAVRLLEILPHKVEIIISNILEGKTRRTKPKLLDSFLTVLGRIEKYGAKDFGKKIKVNESCNGCGWCVKSCPKNNIVLENGKAKFGGECILCTKCLYGCPKKALDAGTGKFIVIKDGFNLSEIEKYEPTDESIEELAKGYVWSGVKKYLLEDEKA